jgi:hypothetical protein
LITSTTSLEEFSPINQGTLRWKILDGYKGHPEAKAEANSLVDKTMVIKMLSLRSRVLSILNLNLWIIR